MEWIINEAMYPEVLIKITIALTLSLVIGVEREIKKKPIGLKTSAVIATFSCLLTIVSIEAAYLVPARDDINVTMDPLRLAAQVVSGIGFLGAGAILRRDNDNITGLTTAAMIWGAASIGIAVGAGFYIEAAFAVLSVMLIIEVLAPALANFGPKRLRSKEMFLTATLLNITKVEGLISYLDTENMTIEHIRLKQVVAPNMPVKHVIELRVITVTNKPTPQLYTELIALPSIEAIEIEIYT